MTDQREVVAGVVRAETVGISPKMWGALVAVVTAVGTYLLGQQALELPAWAVVLIQVVVIGATTVGTIYGFGPGRVAPKGPA